MILENLDSIQKLINQVQALDKTIATSSDENTKTSLTEIKENLQQTIDDLLGYTNKLFDKYNESIGNTE